jgi:hypothetical protein
MCGNDDRLLKTNTATVVKSGLEGQLNRQDAKKRELFFLLLLGVLAVQFLFELSP